MRRGVSARIVFCWLLTTATTDARPSGTTPSNDESERSTIEHALNTKNGKIMPTDHLEQEQERSTSFGLIDDDVYHGKFSDEHKRSASFGGIYSQSNIARSSESGQQQQRKTHPEQWRERAAAPNRPSIVSARNKQTHPQQTAANTNALCCPCDEQQQLEDWLSQGSIYPSVGNAVPLWYTVFVSIASISIAAGLIHCNNISEQRNADEIAKLKRQLAAKELARKCPLCFDDYDDSTSVVPRILPCGHTSCHLCLQKMLTPLQAQGKVKIVECPVCRETCAVPGGQAANLTKVYDLLPL